MDLLALFLDSNGVSTDTRTLSEGQLYFALKGPNFDGNRYAEAALAAGAKAAVVDDASLTGLGNVVVVADVLSALQQLARAYRDTWTCPVIALTGSNGKTTTKELTVACLQREYEVGYTRGNLNNHIGVPLTLLRTPASVDVVVVEMGANHRGEIAALCEIAAPTHGYITNIGTAHLEGFGGVEGIRQGKGELFDFLAANDRHAFVDVADAETNALAARVAQRLTYASGAERGLSQRLLLEGTLDAEFPAVTCTLTDGQRTVRVASRLPGVHNYRNICAAAVVAHYFKVDLEEVAAAIREYSPSNARSEVRTLDRAAVLCDYYNANPDSMRVALRWLANRPESRKLAVLGEMAELGDYAPEAHASVLAQAERLDGVRVVAFGRAYAKTGSGTVAHVGDIGELRGLVAEFAREPDGVVLLKGSRSSRLERVLAKA